MSHDRSSREPLGRALIRPKRLYVWLVLPWQEPEKSGMAHITGGGTFTAKSSASSPKISTSNRLDGNAGDIRRLDGSGDDEQEMRRVSISG